MTGWPHFTTKEFLIVYTSAIRGDLNTAKINFEGVIRANRSQCQREVLCTEISGVELNECPTRSGRT